MIFGALMLDPSDLLGWLATRGAQLHLVSPITGPRMKSCQVADCASRIAPTCLAVAFMVVPLRECGSSLSRTRALSGLQSPLLDLSRQVGDDEPQLAAAGALEIVDQPGVDGDLRAETRA